MSKVGWEARVGALAFMAGVSWVGLQTAGVASAETGGGDSSSVSANHTKPSSGAARHSPSAARASAKKSSAGSRPVARSGVASPLRVENRATATTPAVATQSRAVASANPIQDLFDNVSLLIRRTFFNKPPTVKPIQITGEHEGVITGTIGAVDPERDVIKYQLIPAGRDFDENGQLVDRGPMYGTVEVASDGTFTYTPGPNFTGTDSFSVLATDVGPHINLLDFFRRESTEAAVEVSQYAIGMPPLRFSFTYDSQSESWWTPAAKGALQAAADLLASQIVPAAERPVTVSYYITVGNSPESNTLGTGGSSFFPVSGIAFTENVVQEKIFTGVDQNGTTADGNIWFNSGHAWSFDGSPDYQENDFESVALHELIHTLGFSSSLSSQSSTGYRTTLDSYLTDSTGAKLFASDGTWVKGGYPYFDGANAVAAYGGLVPMSGDGSHLDGLEFAGSLMSPSTYTGVRRIRVSAVELGILEDLGYTVATVAV
jgi:hypothetical protein